MTQKDVDGLSRACYCYTAVFQRLDGNVYCFEVPALDGLNVIEQTLEAGIGAIQRATKREVARRLSQGEVVPEEQPRSFGALPIAGEVFVDDTLLRASDEQRPAPR